MDSTLIARVPPPISMVMALACCHLLKDCVMQEDVWCVLLGGRAIAGWWLRADAGQCGEEHRGFSGVYLRAQDMSGSE